MTQPSKGGRQAPYTLTALNRWSVANRTLPPVDKIKALHIYDFDNTLFNSPLPNPKLWAGPTIGFLQTQDVFSSGGWWHDARILAATGGGAEVEEPRAWQGWWNERVVELLGLSTQQPDALCVLLTGRAEAAFAPLLQRMLAAKRLAPHMLVLKPAVGPSGQRFASTMAFKLAFFRALMETYRQAEEIRVYEDRIRHVKEFRDFFAEYNTAKRAQPPTSPLRGSISAEVIQVADASTSLDPVVEAAEVQRLLNDHNASVATASRGTRYQIKKTVFYTGYMIGEEDSQRLLNLMTLPNAGKDHDLKILANNILITPRPAPHSILDKVGGHGAKATWEVIASAVFENKIWALQVRIVPEGSRYYTENPTPMVVLAFWKGTKPIDATKIVNWQPIGPGKMLRFETSVGEKVLLRVEEEIQGEDGYESLFANKAYKRKHDTFEGRTGSGRNADTATPLGGPSGRGRGAMGHDRGRGRHISGNHANNTGKDRGRGRGAAIGRGGDRGRGSGRNGQGNSPFGHSKHGHQQNPAGNGSVITTPQHHNAASNNNNNNNKTHNYPSDAPTGPKFTGHFDANGGYDPTVSYEDFPPLQKQYQTPQQLVQQQFEQFALQQQQQQQQVHHQTQHQHQHQHQHQKHPHRGGGASRGRSASMYQSRDAAVGNTTTELQYF